PGALASAGPPGRGLPAGRTGEARRAMSHALPRVRVRFSRAPADPLSGYALLSLVAHGAAFGLIAAVLALPSRPAKPPDPGFFVRLAELPPAGGGAAAVPDVPRPAEPKPAPKPEARTEPKEPPKKEVVLPEHADRPERPKKPPASPAPPKMQPAEPAA